MDATDLLTAILIFIPLAGGLALAIVEIDLWIYGRKLARRNKSFSD